MGNLHVLLVPPSPIVCHPIHSLYTGDCIPCSIRRILALHRGCMYRKVLLFQYIVSVRNIKQEYSYQYGYCSFSNYTVHLGLTVMKRRYAVSV